MLGYLSRVQAPLPSDGCQAKRLIICRELGCDSIPGLATQCQENEKSAKGPLLKCRWGRMSAQRRRLVIHVVTLLLCVVPLIGGTQLLATDTQASNIATTVLQIVTVILASAALCNNNVPLRSPWWFGVAGMAFSAVIDSAMLLTNSELLQGSASTGTIYILSYVCFTLMLLGHARGWSRFRDLGHWLNAGIVFVTGSMLLAVAAAVGWSYLPENGQQQTNVFSFVVLNVPLVIASSWLWFSNANNWSVKCAALSPVGITLLYMGRLLENHPQVNIPDGFFLVWLLTYACILASCNLAEPHIIPAVHERRYRLHKHQQVTLIACLLTPAAVLCAVGLTGFDIPWGILASGSAIITILGVCRIAGLLNDVSNQEDKLRQLASTDPLTGLMNRRQWQHEIEHITAEQRQSPHWLAVIDIDYFKLYNDQYGHQAGDVLLAAAAKVWQEQLPQNAVLARYGGEEFCVLLRDVEPDHATRLLQDVRRSTPQQQTCSVGLTRWHCDESVEEVFGRADRYLYEAKRSGRNRLLGDSVDLTDSATTLDLTRLRQPGANREQADHLAQTDHLEQPRHVDQPGQSTSAGKRM